MNHPADYLKRLLKLYPVSTIKESFGVEGSFNEFVDKIIPKKDLIKSFAEDCHGLTKQNIYIFSIKKKYNKDDNLNGLDLRVQTQKVSETGEYIFFALPICKFSVYLNINNNIKLDEINFYQPLLIKISEKHLIIQFTKLEKNLSHYFPAENAARKVDENNSEEEILYNILSYFSLRGYNPLPLDMNAGIKHLWEIDTLDCHRISWLEEFSTAERKMHGDLTFKLKYPKLYEEMKHTPLGKSVWKYLIKDNYFCELFTTNVNTGVISVTSFPKTSNQISNVVNKILEHN